jgi:hypothetical protein
MDRDTRLSLIMCILTIALIISVTIFARISTSSENIEDENTLSKIIVRTTAHIQKDSFLSDREHKPKIIETIIDNKDEDIVCMKKMCFCKYGYDYLNDKCSSLITIDGKNKYYLNNLCLNWTEAERFCSKIGLYLFTPNDNDEVMNIIVQFPLLHRKNFWVNLLS